MERRECKEYKLGLVVGRFQPLHKGHVSIIQAALDKCERVIVLIGSCQEKRTLRNPLSYNERKQMIRDVFGRCNENLVIAPTVNIGGGDCAIWGNYLMNVCKFECDEYPDAYFTGTEPDRNYWFENYDIKTIVVDRGILPISATELRTKIVNNEDWEEYVPRYGNKDLIADIIKCVYSKKNLPIFNQNLIDK